MSKTLTEQWREGTLETNWYYCLLDTSECIGEPKEQKQIMYYEDGFDYNEDLIIEILSAVPSYVQYNGLMDDSKELDKAYDKISLLEKRLEIATKALEETRKRIEDFNDDPMNKIGFMAYGTLHECLNKSKKALKEMEGVK